MLLRQALMGFMYLQVARRDRNLMREPLGMRRPVPRPGLNGVRGVG